MKEKEWCIALDNVSPYTDPLLGQRYIFLKGEHATKEKVFGMIPSMTEEEYAKYFRPATEEEINGEFDWDGEQYVLKDLKIMKELTIEQKAKRYDKAIKRAKDFMNGEAHYELKIGENIMCWVFPELRESGDEKIRKHIIEVFKDNFSGEDTDRCIAWLEKQGEHAKFRDSIQVGDKVTRNQDGMLVNLSRLKRVAKKEATGKLKECIDTITEESLAKARKQLQEESQVCMYSKDNYTEEDRKVLCEDCKEKCAYAIAGVISTNAQVKKEPVSEDLEEAAKRYATEGDEISGLYIIEPEADAFKAGAQWQKQKDEGYTKSMYKVGINTGKELMKQQLMSKAVEITKEEIYEWLNSHNDYITVNGSITRFDMEKCIKDLKQAMRDE